MQHHHAGAEPLASLVGRRDAVEEALNELEAANSIEDVKSILKSMLLVQQAALKADDFND